MGWARKQLDERSKGNSKTLTAVRVESQNEPQQQNSNTESPSNFEPGSRNSQGPKLELVRAKTEDATKAYPLGVVMRAYPKSPTMRQAGSFDDHGGAGEGYLGISPSAYEDALDVFGRENAAIVIACILLNMNSVGGYLRAVNEKPRAGKLSLGPMLMAALKANGVHPRLVTAT